MMKILIISLSGSLLLANIACTSKKEHHEAEQHKNADSTSTNESWVEMDAFHEVMAESFHPFKDSANLEPAKANASQLAEAADKWANAPLPEKMDNEGVRSKLRQLREETTTFSQVVLKSDDKTIGDALTKLHDLFHELQEAWYSGSAGHEEHH